MTILNEIKKKIQNKEIEPKSKLHFYFVNFVWWFLFVLLFIISSIAFGVMIYMFKEADWEIVRLVSSGIWGKILLVLPRLWLLLIIITTILAVWEFRKTKKGYRYDIIGILTVVFFGSITFGSLIYVSGFSERLDSLLTDNISIYHGRLRQQMELWDRGEKGLLIGRLISIDGDDIVVHAPGGIVWEVDISSVDNLEELELDSILKIRGEQLKEQKFIANTLEMLEMERFFGGHKPPIRPFMSPMRGNRDGERFPMRPAY